MTAPVTGGPCVGYELVVLLESLPGRWFSIWSPLSRESSCADFELAVENGPLHVEAARASTLALRKTVTRISSGAAARNGVLGAVLDRCGVTSRRSRVELREGIIVVGDSVVVWGGDAVEVDPRAPAAGYRDPPLRRVLAGDQSNPVVVSNIVGAGLIDQPILSRRGVLRALLRRGHDD